MSSVLNCKAFLVCLEGCFCPVCLANIDHLLSFMYVELVASHQLYFFFLLAYLKIKTSLYCLLYYRTLMLGLVDSAGD